MTTTTKERPIIFSAESVRAILTGRKTMTRRVAKVPTNIDVDVYFNTILKEWRWLSREPDEDELGGSIGDDISNPFGAVGDRLWVRETWALENEGSPDPRVVWCADRAARYVEREYFSDGRPLWLSQFFWLASDYQPPARWRSPIHLPRWASRITLEITEIRVELLRDITNEDAIAEGCTGGPDVEGYSESNPADPYEEYAILWDRLNKKRGYSWDSNPFVWVIGFRPIP